MGDEMTNEEFITIELSRDLLREMTDRYEEMFFQFQSMRRVLGQTKALPLFGEYANIVADPASRSAVHAQFADFRASIAKITPATKANDLISKIPRVPVAR
jgi:hypothetical protein